MAISQDYPYPSELEKANFVQLIDGNIVDKSWAAGMRAAMTSSISCVADSAETESWAYIEKAITEIKALLKDKNTRYRDSAFNPARVFSDADATEQILVRIDDKLSRVMYEKGQFG